MRKVKIGIIGLGNMGSTHVKLIRDLPEAELAAVCDIDRDRADAKAQEAGPGCRAFYSADELYRSGCVEAVLIAVPHYAHTPLAIEAFEHGLHVLCEKPIAVTKSMAQSMLDAHAKHPELRFGLMFQQRVHGGHRKIRELIDNGEFGKIQRVIWTCSHWFRPQIYFDSGSWRATWAGEGGGALLNQCPHNLDLFLWFFGLPRRVVSQVAIGKYHNIEVEDDVNAFVEFPGGSTGNFITSTGECPGSNRLEIYGTRGRMVFEDDKITFCRTEQDVAGICANSTASFPKVPVWNIEIPYRQEPENPHRQVTRAFLNAILDPFRELVADGEDGIRAIELGNAILYSGIRGVPVELPIDTAAYDAMLQELIENSKNNRKEVRAANVDMGNSF
ncbi:MAG: Gfo/Idh/MocA family oxidoreductase [Lentisphaeria bacterium]|nr:Gfo/Idh/MocA family oxidoreductase [Lentisphaeria bacterium]